MTSAAVTSGAVTSGAVTRTTIVIPSHDERRLPRLAAVVRAALAQGPARVIVVIDHNPPLADRARRELPGIAVLENRFARGVSGARNTGAHEAETPLITLLDDDVTARPGWLAALVRPFDDPRVIGTGGAIAPAWHRRRPPWFPDEFLWAVGASYAGMPTTTARVRNVWSASMTVRRDAFEAVGGFRVGFGKIGDRARPEDTELCLRMSDATGGHWVYVPDAVVEHPVPADRGTLRYFLARCYHEGRGKVAMARLLRGRESLGSERDYLRRTLPAAVRRDGVAKASAVLAGMAAAAAGGAVELLR